MGSPWVEQYRPKMFQEIVLDECNRLFFSKIMESDYIPNMIFYGPPGTGKTTTILNLIRVYQEKHGEINNGFMIHLNASDERGVDTIRSQISTFVHSKPLFKTGTKFVVLDEVDSMTKNAQQALSYMLHAKLNVCFCLICNYISKIDDSLQTMFIKIKFNKLPREMILTVLETIVRAEKLSYTRQQLEFIQSLYESDIRSMINCLQLNQDNPAMDIIHADVWDELYQLIRSGENVHTLVERMYTISRQYNMDIKHILKDFIYHVWVTYKPSIPITQLDNAFHHSNINPDHMLRHVILSLN
jgi:DNA polymerase III delta prime subunit